MCECCLNPSKALVSFLLGTLILCCSQTNKGCHSSERYKSVPSHRPRSLACRQGGEEICKRPFFPPLTSQASSYILGRSWCRAFCAGRPQSFLTWLSVCIFHCRKIFSDEKGKQALTETAAEHNSVVQTDASENKVWWTRRGTSARPNPLFFSSPPPHLLSRQRGVRNSAEGLISSALDSHVRLTTPRSASES